MIIGKRVFAISHATKDTVYSYGHGVYVGEEPAMIETMEINIPAIKLDSGFKIFGAQCWWGPIEDEEKTIAGRTVVMVTPGEVKE
jgi:hypothetical protein